MKNFEKDLEIIKDKVLDIEIEKYGFSAVEKCFYSSKMIIDENYEILNKLINK